MKPLFKSILIPIRSPQELDVLLPISVRLASQAGPRLDFVDFTGTKAGLETPVFKESFREKSGEYHILHETRPFKEGVLPLIQERSSELLLLCTREFKQDLDQIPSLDVQNLIEKCPIPVVAVPQTYDSHQPWNSILVPMSGEVRMNKALELSIRIANTLNMAVDVVHVVRPDEPVPAIVARFSDDAHHELPRMIDEFLTEASPLTPIEEKKCLRDFRILHGSTEDEILSRVEEGNIDLVAIQWKGTLMTGHASILKAILKETNCPVLLVKQDQPAHFKLKAGHHLDRRKAG